MIGTTFKEEFQNQNEKRDFRYYFKTRKAIGFKSLRLNCSDITQVNIKMEMSTTVSKILTYYPIQSYLIKRQIYYASVTDVFLGNLWIFQKQSPKVFYEKNCS